VLVRFRPRPGALERRRRPLHIGLEDPAHPGTSSVSVALQGSKCIASSGDTFAASTVRQAYGHIVDQRTGLPVANGCRGDGSSPASCLQAGVL